MKKFFLFAIVLAFITVIGCGSGFVPTGGKVTFDDGSPVPFGSVAFETDAFMAEGSIKPDGSYTLTSLRPGDGLPPGTYRVGIGATEMDENDRPIYHVDLKFANPATSGLTATVSRRNNRFDFIVTRP